MEKKRSQGSTTILFEEFQKIPQVDARKDGRVVFLAPFLNMDGTWDFWMPVPGQGLMKLIAKPARQFYYGLHPESPSDIEFRFYQLLVQHLSFPGTVQLLKAIEDDFVNVCASLGKLDLFDELMRSKNPKYDHLVFSTYAGTELEYFFYVLRSMYDHLQQISKVLMGTFQNLSTGEKIMRQELPNSFADMLYQNNIPMSAEEIQSRREIPKPLAEFYASCGPIFHAIRKFRNSVDHDGQSGPTIFHTEDGFLVSMKENPFARFAIWKDSEKFKNDLAPLSKVFAFFLNESLKAFETFADTIASFTSLPGEMVPNHKVYLRTEHNDNFWRYRKMLD